MENDGKTEVEREHDEFADAFAQLASNLKEPGAAEAAKPAEAAAAAETPEAKAAREAAAATAAAAETPEAKAAREAAAATAAAAETPEAKAAREAAAAAAAGETPEAKAAREAATAATTAAAAEAAKPDLAAQLADATRRLAELEAARTAQPAAAAQPEKSTEPELYSEEEKAAIAKYTEEWDTVRRGEELIRRAEYRELCKFIYSQVEQRFAPLMSYVDNRAPRDQYTDLISIVPDYDAVRDKAVAWATGDAQPSIVRNAYKQVVEEGTPEEVKEMIDAWRKATNHQAPAASSPAATATAAAAPAAGAPVTPAANDPARVAAAAALRPVSGERTVRTDGPDPNDFAGAFAEFATATAR